MFGTREDMREFAGQLYALVVATAEPSENHPKYVKDLLANLQGQVGCLVFKPQFRI